MKNLIIIILFAVIITSCKKPPVNTSTQTNTTPTATNTVVVTPTVSNIDTSKTGLYKMIYCSIANELSSGLSLRVKYKEYYWNNQNDTNDKVIVYSFPSNVNAQGQLKISKSNTYKNEGVNNSTPFINEHNSSIPYGFLECKLISFNGGLFSGDTMVLNFYINNPPNSYSLKCKYKK